MSRDYLEEHSLNIYFESLTEALLHDRPADPRAFMLSWIQKNELPSKPTTAAFDLKSRAVVAKRSPFGVDVKKGETYYWCSCGRSQNQPFCDGSHVKANEQLGTKFAPVTFTASSDETVYLCGCKQSANAPFCDGTHTKVAPEKVGKEAGTGSAPTAAIAVQEFTDGAQTYPPAKANAVVGQHSGAFDKMHQMAFRGWRPDTSAADIVQEAPVDLVVVGAGVSGLSAAHFYKQRFGSDKKILILDCLGDIGGHAKRNELSVDGGKTLIGYGGSESFQSPKGNFSPVCHQLMKDLGIDVAKFETDYFKENTYPSLGMSRGAFFTGRNFPTSEGESGGGKLVTGDPTEMVADDLPRRLSNARSLEAFIGDFPMSDSARRELLACWTDKDRKINGDPAYLAKTAYDTFLKEQWGLGAEALQFFTQRTLDFFGLPASHVAALDAVYYGYPGCQGVVLPPSEEAEAEMTEQYVHHFPDGNASVARLLARSLNPQCLPGSTAEDALLAKLDYAALASGPQRVQLNATCLKVTPPAAEGAQSTAGEVVVHYITHQDDKVHKVACRHATLACFNMVIPYILDGVQEPQAALLKDNVKAPLVYTNVALRNWEAFAKLGVHEVFGVDLFHSRIKLDYPVSLGGYECATKPSEPILVHMVHVPASVNPLREGEKKQKKAEGDDAAQPTTSADVAAPDARSALRSARSKLFALSFDEYQAAIRDDLTRLLKPGGFDYDRDVAAVTVNRWSHGYAWVGNSLSSDGEDGAGPKRDAARKPVGGGTVTIANSDAGYSAYLHAAIDEAHRAVRELRA